MGTPFVAQPVNVNKLLSSVYITVKDILGTLHD